MDSYEQFLANFKIDTDLTPQDIMNYVNQYLPEDIGVTDICEMPERFHSRLNAKKKTYRYRIWNTSLPCVFERKYVYVLEDTLDAEAMKRAAVQFIGQHDFKAFTSNKKSKKSTVRTIERIDIERTGNEVTLTYTGDGFLYHMVRILTGTLIEVGLGRRTEASMQELLECGTRDMAGPLVPAKGLCLVAVYY